MDQLNLANFNYNGKIQRGFADMSDRDVTVKIVYEISRELVDIDDEDALVYVCF